MGIDGTATVGKENRSGKKTQPRVLLFLFLLFPHVIILDYYLFSPSLSVSSVRSI
ncbi:uncharacterized protein BO87DRAFT_23094 [Aspergillus neoniger CBS 115656]|uniref:Uncharacterized protein n=1 Tax=Aspergillus neoniger (strain CBS 115656) TaxID=1448310 RepID=A0A318YMB9_ASPNB|nr:hypothetical protein BO87DRAFT_23094 [Aspergillus neoniger CBS 115656]PYH35761.1 hypothetical protein BO87DRAFT_23094 [Aspergillus neoniger CBS 115656]